MRRFGGRLTSKLIIKHLEKSKKLPETEREREREIKLLKFKRMGDQVTLGFVVVEKNTAAGVMQEQESPSTEKQMMDISTLSLDSAAHESLCAKCVVSPAGSNSVVG